MSLLNESRGRPGIGQNIEPAPTTHMLSLSATQPIERPDSTASGFRFVATARAVVAAPPAAGRRLWCLVVRCPYCSTRGVTSLHVHRADDLDGEVRRAAGCGRGVYVITVGAP